MNPQLLKVIPQPNQSFSIRQDLVPFFYNRWHFHPEVELVHIQKGSGIQFVGDSIRPFRKDDMILVGSMLPHLWRCDDLYFEKGSRLRAKATVAHFREDFWGKEFLELPENKKIRELLVRAKRGLLIRGKTRTAVAALMPQLLKAGQTERIIILLRMLSLIAGAGNHTELLATSGFQPQTEGTETGRINKVYAYTLARFKEKISLEDIAAVANISPHSFCRFFKSHTRKTYNNFLRELRIGHACKLLMGDKLSLTQVCYNSGFNNVTNFYKAFRQVTGRTPVEYRKEFVS